MQEKMQPNLLEAEIADLTSQIEKKRAELEAKQDIVTDDKQVVASVVRDNLNDEVGAVAIVSDGAVDESEEPRDTGIVESKVAAILSVFQESGLGKAISEVKDEHPSVVDAFHDKLVDELYDTLRKQGIVE